MQLRKWSVITALGLAAVVASGTAAVADPINPDTNAPTLNRALNGTGSDTTQDLNNGLSAVVRNSAGQLILGSWDATLPSSGVTTIVTRTNGTTIPRPNGSSQGVAALKAAVSGNAYNNERGNSSGPLTSADLQFARSSSGIAANATGNYTYIPLAVDAVSYAVKTGSTVPADLTVAQLTQIYRSANGASITINGTSYIVGNESNPNATIRPFLPQSGSGTRSFFLGQLGMTEGEQGTAVAASYSGGSVQEHDGSVVDAVANSLVPFSVAQYVAQGNATALSSAYQVQVVNRLHNVKLGKINGADPVTSAGVLNTNFPVKRAVFTVVPTASVTGANASSDLASVFAGATGKAYLAESPDNSSWVIEDFGFGSLINRDTDVNGVTIGSTVYRAGDTTTFRTN